MKQQLAYKSACLLSVWYFVIIYSWLKEGDGAGRSSSPCIFSWLSCPVRIL